MIMAQLNRRTLDRQISTIMGFVFLGKKIVVLILIEQNRCKRHSHPHTSIRGKLLSAEGCSSFPGDLLFHDLWWHNGSELCCRDWVSSGQWASHLLHRTHVLECTGDELTDFIEPGILKHLLDNFHICYWSSSLRLWAVSCCLGPGRLWAVSCCLGPGRVRA